MGDLPLADKIDFETGKGSKCIWPLCLYVGQVGGSARRLLVPNLIILQFLLNRVFSSIRRQCGLVEICFICFSAQF